MKNIKKEFTLSNPDPKKLSWLRWVRSKNFLIRLFRPVRKGSLRGVVLLWIRMTVGVGILTLPVLLSNFGLVSGILALGFGAFLCHFCYKAIFEASLKTKIKEYS